jgi:UDP-N-acetylmuramoyl-L-alanyl-D-glutamate--2,6-diaminopimelate ligase
LIVQRLDKLIDEVVVEEISGDTGIGITELMIDSRKKAAGGLFFAVRGTSMDGHDYIDQAISAGAVAVICESIPGVTDNRISYVRVKDSAYALGIIASAFYGYPSRKLKLTGITGTNGKTTTATLLYRLFGKLGFRSGLISTVNYFIDDKVIPATHTTPDPVKLNWLLAEMVKKGCKYCFMEVSSHSVVQKRIAGLHFAGGVYTNISHDHLDYHKTFMEYMLAKKLFFDNLPPGSFALVNKDDRNSAFMVQNTKALSRTYALRSMADFRGSVIESHPGGMLLRLNGKELWTSFIGGFNAYNLLAVFSTAILLEADEDEALRNISSLTAVEGRFETIRSSSEITAVIDYAHTPDALENVIETIRPMLAGTNELITVTGAGGDRDRAKRPVMAKIASEKSHKLILTSDNPRSEDPGSIISDMLEGVKDSLRDRVLCITSREEAIRTACMMARPGDFILIAGKGHETYQEIKGVKHHFDDREIVRAIFAAKTK